MPTINKNWKWSEESKKRQSEIRKGVPRGHYKPKENVGYWGLHDWIKRTLSKPDKCQECHKSNKLDAANISGQYLRDINDWVFVCRSCHKQYDMMINGKI